MPALFVCSYRGRSVSPLLDEVFHMMLDGGLSSPQFANPSSLNNIRKHFDFSSFYDGNGHYSCIK
jgi:hypothetical protein